MAGLGFCRAEKGAAAPAPSASSVELPRYAVTKERLEAMPPEQRAAWQGYMERSQEAATLLEKALLEEVKAAGLAEALPAPDGGDFSTDADPGEPWYGTPEAAVLASVILSWQCPVGGWSKHLGYSKGPRKPAMQWTSQSKPGTPPHYLATIDNGATTEEILLLAAVWEKTGREDCRQGVLRGLDYLFAAQYPNGGWPQTWPLEGGYHDNITCNDDAMTRVLELLYQLQQRKPWFACVDEPHRAKALQSLAAGTRCLLAAQHRQGGVLTGWCAQFDPLTLAPAGARLKEPAALGGPETSSILKFLMRDQQPDAERKAAIEAGLTWLEQVKISHLREDRKDGRKVYIEDPACQDVLWARFYDLSTNKPLFAGGQDGIIYETYAAMVQKNKAGYDFYTGRPLSVLTTGQKKWRRMLSKIEAQ